MINKGQLTENAQQLLTYSLACAQGYVGHTDEGDKKLTCVLSYHYHDALTRMAILQGKTKTAVVRQAIDALVKQFGEDTLYPAIDLRLIEEE